MTELLDQRRKTLEEAFFAKKNRELLDKMRARAAAEEQAKALAEASGIADEQVLQHLIDAGLSAETVAALSLVPLVAVAWADGEMEDRERSAVLEAAANSGLDAGSSSRELLEGWLATRPDASLLASWKAYVSELHDSLEDGARQALSDSILGRAREVATSAGGLLGIGSISQIERQMLDELEQALA